MGKKSKAPQYPEYSNGAVTINGKKVATATKKGNTVSTNYNMSKNEKSMLNSIQGNMNKEALRELLASMTLEEKVGKLRNEVKDLRNAIEGVYDCPYRNECTVRERMRQQPSGCEPVGRTTD